jgi:maltooligosyltrehalose trehalohydrolase
VLDDGQTAFLLWAPKAKVVTLRLKGPDRDVPMAAGEDGYHWALAGVGPGTCYAYSLDGGDDRPDPASRSQPGGPHGPSEVVAGDFPWTDAAWKNPALRTHVLYELHVGTFTTAGTFDAAAEHLAELRELGVTAVELMPVAQFTGARNWGYDGVALFAAQNSYGGPAGLKRFVDAAHRHGLAVVLDVVYNHLGPEGNYLGEFGPFFTERYKTPWGPALNFDGPGADDVRRFFIENALQWTDEFHIDALRLDAVHAIVDPTPVPFIEDLCAAVHARAAERGRVVHLIAESAANDARLITPRAAGGHGADAQWNDDFHHALRTLLTGDRAGYYASYGGLAHLQRAYEHGFVYTGQRSAFHERRHGSPSRRLPADRFVVFTQNHDHVGNRMKGERLNTLVGPERARLAAAAVILSPFVPLLFMGEEYAETAPFLYFVSHTDPALVEAVRNGRAEEFAPFVAKGEEAPDPQSEDTFVRSRLAHGLKHAGDHARTLAFYKRLLTLRRTVPAFATLDKDALDAARDDAARTLTIRRLHDEGDGLLIMNFSAEPARASLPPGPWSLLINSRAPEWGDADPGPPPPETIDDAPTALTLPAWAALAYARRPF